MEPANDLVCESVSPCGKFRLRLDDDGKVAYAYFIRGDAIVGDVWVYNRRPVPDRSEWNDPQNLPFANLPELTTEEGSFEMAVPLDDIAIEWRYVGEQPRAFVYLYGTLVASVGENEKPGYCRFAAKDGPLAKVLVAEQASGEIAPGRGDTVHNY